MRFLFFTLFVPLILFGTKSFAQPANDDCSGLIDLGVAPICTDNIFSNVDATASDIGFGNSPSCYLPSCLLMTTHATASLNRCPLTEAITVCPEPGDQTGSQELRQVTEDSPDDPNCHITF